jgi:hypothetical protein
MIFLIRYDRSRGVIEDLRTFAEDQRKRAHDERLALEVALQQQGVDREVVLLEAASLDALRVTHRRYFESAAVLATSTATATGVSRMIVLGPAS